MQTIALKKLKNITLLAVLVLFVTIAFYRVHMSYEAFDRDKNYHRDIAFKQSDYIFKSKLNEMDKVFANRLQNIISEDEIKDALRQKNTSKLHNLAIEKYRDLKRDFPDIIDMNFYMKGEKSLLKVCASKSCESTKEIKANLIDVLNTKSVKSGFDSTIAIKDGFPYGIVVPIVDGKKLLGVVELNVDTRDVLKKINGFFDASSDTKVFMGFLFRKKDSLGKSKETLGLNDYDFVVINKVHKEIIKKLKFSKKEQEVEFEGRKFYVFWGKKILKGFDNKQVGTTFYAFDVTNLESEFRSNIARSIIQPMTVMFFLYVIFFLLFSYIKRQSNLHSEKLSGIVNNQSSLIILTNGETIIQSNQSFLKFFDISTVDEFLDNYTCVCEKFEEEEGYLKREYTDKNWLTYIIENPELNHKTKMKDKDGNEHIFQVNARSIKQENKFEYVVSFDDITTLIDVNKNLEKLVMSKTKELRDINSKLEVKIKEAIKENRQKDQQLFQQSRLAQMGEMISMIAHQWRQPLNAISAASMSMNLKAKLNKLDNELAINLTAKISEYSQHLSSTIDDFRDFFKANKEKEKTTYEELLKMVLNIVETSIVNKNIKLVKNLNSQKVFCTNPNELKQVILNLIKNAEDVLLDRNVENPKITIETNDNVLTISDNGGGIPEDIIDKIFDPYFSTKSKKDGTGLGLYMSKIIIEEHCGGKLSVTNAKEGAVFKVELFD